MLDEMNERSRDLVPSELGQAKSSGLPRMSDTGRVYIYTGPAWSSLHTESGA
jgi:hypothetical protein